MRWSGGSSMSTWVNDDVVSSALYDFYEIP